MMKNNTVTREQEEMLGMSRQAPNSSSCSLVHNLLDCKSTTAEELCK